MNIPNHSTNAEISKISELYRPLESLAVINAFKEQSSVNRFLKGAFEISYSEFCADFGKNFSLNCNNSITSANFANGLKQNFSLANENIAGEAVVNFFANDTKFGLATPLRPTIIFTDQELIKSKDISTPIVIDGTPEKAWAIISTKKFTENGLTEPQLARSMLILATRSAVTFLGIDRSSYGTKGKGTLGSWYNFGCETEKTPRYCILDKHYNINNFLHTANELAKYRKDIEVNKNHGFCVECLKIVQEQVKKYN
jgi:hypothetical protein